jgi:uncharacterized protein YjiS (DUF1127 family)
MNAYTSKDELALLNTSRTSFAELYAADRDSRPSLFQRVVAFFQRQSTLAELGQLTDRELADIGLQRGELHRVFEPAFANARAR